MSRAFCWETTQVDFFVLFRVFKLIKNYSWIIKWINQKYLYVQEYCMCISHTHTCTYRYIYIYPQLHTWSYIIQSDCDFTMFSISMVMMCHITSRLLKISLYISFSIKDINSAMQLQVWHAFTHRQSCTNTHSGLTKG